MRKSYITSNFERNLMTMFKQVIQVNSYYRKTSQQQENFIKFLSKLTFSLC